MYAIKPILKSEIVKVKKRLYQFLMVPFCLICYKNCKTFLLSKRQRLDYLKTGHKWTFAVNCGSVFAWLTTTHNIFDIFCRLDQVSLLPNNVLELSLCWRMYLQVGRILMRHRHVGPLRVIVPFQRVLPSPL